MFGLGIWEIALLCVALLVFVRPEELPKVMGKLGQWYGKVTGSSRYLMRQFQEPFEAADDEPEGGGNSIAAEDRKRRQPRDAAEGTESEGDERR
jgi:Sec-independent protein translocase protein TatA